MWASSLVRHVSECAWALVPLWPVLLDAAVKGVAVLGLTALATVAMRRSSAAGRHLVWVLGVVSVLVLPVLAAGLPGWHVLPGWGMGGAAEVKREAEPMVMPAAGPARAGMQVVPSDAPVVGETGGFASAPARAASDAALPVVPGSAPHLGWQGWVLVVWAAGSGMLLGYVALGALSLAWLGRRSSRITSGEWAVLLREICGQLGVRRPVELLGSARRTMPMTWGVWRTRLLLPEDCGTWAVEQRRAVLLHELAHAKRWDCLTQLIVQIACALYWFNPLVWVAWHRIQAERERACDDLVLLSMGTKASAYAEQLLHMASEMPAVRYSAAAIAMARPSKLESRLLAILDMRRNRRALTWSAAVLAAALVGVFVVPLAMVRAEAGPVEAAPSTRPSPFAAQLPGGVTVELLGICEHPSEGKQWWRPDGSALAEAPYDDPRTGEVSGSALRREFAIRTINPNGVELKYQIPLPFTSRHQTAPQKAGQPIKDMITWAVAFLTDVDKVTLRVGAPTEKWNTVATTTGHGPGSQEGGPLVFSPMTVNDGDVQIFLNHAITDRETRLLAITADGPTTPTNAGHAASGSATLDTYTFHGLKPEQIREFQFQTCRFEWVEFRDVPLHPKGRSEPTRKPSAVVTQAIAAQPATQPVTRPLISSAPNLSLEARVVGIDGKPVESCSITFWRIKGSKPEARNGGERGPSGELHVWNDPTTGRMWEPFRNWATSDRATVSDLPPGDYRIAAALGHNGFSPLGVSDIVHLDGSRKSTVITVALQTGPTLQVTAIDAQTHAPVEWGEILLTRPDGLPVARWASDPWAISAEKGRVSFPHLAPGEYTLRAGKRARVFGDVEYVLQGEPMKITMANEDQVVTIMLKSTELPQAEVEKRWPWVVVGKVTGGDGKPMEGVTLSASCGMGSLFQTGRAISGADGGYTLRFGPGMRMWGTNGPWGAGLQAATISARMAGYFEKNLGRQGDLGMADEPPSDGRAWPGTRLVLPGKPFEVNFVMLPAARLQGRLLNESGTPMARHTIFINGNELPPSSSVLAQMETDATGQFRFDSLPTGYAWRLELKNGPAADLRASQPGLQEIILRVQQGGRGLVLEFAAMKVPATQPAVWPGAAPATAPAGRIGDDGGPPVQSITEAATREAMPGKIVLLAKGDMIQISQGREVITAKTVKLDLPVRGGATRSVTCDVFKGKVRVRGSDGSEVQGSRIEIDPIRGDVVGMGGLVPMFKNLMEPSASPGNAVTGPRKDAPGVGPRR